MRFFCAKSSQNTSITGTITSRIHSVMQEFETCIQHDSVWIGFNDAYGIDRHENDGFFALVDGHFSMSRNVKDLKLSLTADTEAPNKDRASLLIELFSHVGNKIWEYLEGSFMAVVLDKQRGTLHFAVDRFGSKRVYYHQDSGNRQVVFSDSIRAILKTLDSVELDRKALTEHIYFRWLVGDQYLFSDVNLMQAAEQLTINPNLAIEKNIYWNVGFDRQELHSSMDGWADATGERFDHLFKRLSQHYQHPVVLLSGGVDSSIIAAFAAKHFDKCIAVTPYWKAGPNPELDMAKRFAKHLGMRHLLIEVTDDDLRVWCKSLHEHLEQTPRHYSSMPLGVVLNNLPYETDLVLHGEAGDEYFGSSTANQYADNAERWQRWNILPGWVRGALEKILTLNMSKKILRNICRYYSRLDISNLEKGIKDLCRVLRTSTDALTYHFKKIVTDIPMENLFPCVDNDNMATNRYVENFAWSEGQWIDRLLKLNIQESSVNNVFTVDRLCSSKHYDVVYPYLTEELRSVGERLPVRWHRVDGVEKPVLKQLGSRYYPIEWMHAPKNGFTTPTLNWLNNQLAEFMGILDEPTTRRRGLMDAEFLSKLEVKREYDILWTAMQLELFMRTFVDGFRNSLNPGMRKLAPSRIIHMPPVRSYPGQDVPNDPILQI